jgi:hypothetical protein
MATSAFVPSSSARYADANVERLGSYLCDLVVVSVAASLVAGLAATAIAGAGGLEPVRARPVIDEFSPAAAPGLVAWAQAHGAGLAAVYVRVGTARPVKVNPPGTDANLGSFDGDRLVYQQSDDRGSQSDLWLYDTATGVRRMLPTGINTPASESSPSLDGEWLLFLREAELETGLFLVNLESGEVRVLAEEDPGSDIEPGDVRGDVAVWTECPSDEGCRSFRYRIRAKTAQRLPSGGAPLQYGVTVTPTGRVYAVRAGRTVCGNVRLVRFDPGSPAVVIARFPRRELFDLSAFEDGSAGTRVYFESHTCDSGDPLSDVLRLLDGG